MESKIQDLLIGLGVAIEDQVKEERSSAKAEVRNEAKARINRFHQALGEAEARHLKRLERMAEAEQGLIKALKENVLLKQKVEAMGTTINGLRKNLRDAEAVLKTVSEGSK